MLAEDIRNQLAEIADEYSKRRPQWNDSASLFQRMERFYEKNGRVPDEPLILLMCRQVRLTNLKKELGHTKLERQNRRRRFVSLDVEVPNRNDGATFADLLAEEPEDLSVEDREDMLQRIEGAIALARPGMTPKQSAFLDGLLRGEKLVDISAKIGVTKQRGRQLACRVRDIIREHLTPTIE